MCKTYCGYSCCECFNPFVAGNIVQLKSGGPLMTVKLVNDAGTLTCNWFDGPDLYEDEFSPASLQRAETCCGSVTHIPYVAQPNPCEPTWTWTTTARDHTGISNL